MESLVAAVVIHAAGSSISSWLFAIRSIASCATSSASLTLPSIGTPPEAAPI